MEMTKLRIALLVIGTGVLLAGGLVATGYYQLQQTKAAFGALHAAGYGESALRHSGHYCGAGKITFAFIAQGGVRSRRDGLENQGYVCAGYFGGASVHETKVDPTDMADWEPSD